MRKKERSDRMISLYTTEEAQRLRRHAGISARTAAIVFLLAFAACIALCFFVRTANASRMLIRVIVLFTLGGWAAILLLNLVYYPARAGYTHMEGILAGETEVREGRLLILPGAFRIPKSITVRKVNLETEGETLHLSVLCGKVNQLPANGSRVRVCTVRNYITAFEVCDEEI